MYDILLATILNTVSLVSRMGWFRWTFLLLIGNERDEALPKSVLLMAFYHKQLILCIPVNIHDHNKLAHGVRCCHRDLLVLYLQGQCDRGTLERRLQT